MVVYAGIGGYVWFLENGFVGRVRREGWGGLRDVDRAVGRRRVLGEGLRYG